MKFNCAFLPGLLKEIGLWLVRLFLSLAILLFALVLVWTTVCSINLLVPIPHEIALTKEITFFNFAALPFVVRLLLVVISAVVWGAASVVYIRTFWIWKKIVRLLGDGKINSQDSINHLLLLKRLLIYQMFIEPATCLIYYIAIWPEKKLEIVARDYGITILIYVFIFALYTWTERRIQRKLQLIAAQSENQP